MNIEDIKVGEAYNVRVRVESIGTKLIACRPLMQNGIPTTFGDNFFKVCEAEAFSPISPENGIKNTETAPKYDPCRKLRRGDRARVVKRNGRKPLCFPVGRIEVGDIVTVAENEAGDVFIKVLTKDGHEMMAPWFMLELIAPVEELEPYTISEGAGIIEVYNEKLEAVKAWFYNDVKAGVKALAEAEAERDRLNAEYRKEQNND